MQLRDNSRVYRFRVLAQATAAEESRVYYVLNVEIISHRRDIAFLIGVGSILWLAAEEWTLK